jgi:hypothetical protein
MFPVLVRGVDRAEQTDMELSINLAAVRKRKTDWIIGLTFLAIGLLPIAVVASVNYYVDPFQYFRISTPPRFSNMMQRLQHPGIVRNYPFDAVVVGNSMVADIRNDMFVDKNFGTQLLNLSFWGSTVREAAYVLDLALRTRPVKTVLWSTGRESILNDFRYGEFPTCMYSRIWSGLPYCYLLNADVFRESLAIVLNLKGTSKAAWVESLEKWKALPTGTGDPHKRDCRIQEYIKADEDIDALTQRAEDNLGPIRSPDSVRFGEIVLPIVRANPEVRFIFLIPPTHIWPLWHNAVKQERLRWQRGLIEVVIGEPNVEIHDLTGVGSVSHNIAYYFDGAHYNLEGTRLVADALASGSMKITSMAQHEQMLKEELRAGKILVKKAFEAKCP